MTEREQSSHMYRKTSDQRFAKARNKGKKQSARVLSDKGLAQMWKKPVKSERQSK